MTSLLIGLILLCPGPTHAQDIDTKAAQAAEYVVFQFNTAFEHKAAAVETVTAAKDTDGMWRIAGYFVK